MRHYISIIICSLLVLNSALAQDYAKDMYTVFNAFSKLKAYSFQAVAVVNIKGEGQEVMTTNVKMSEHGQMVSSDEFTLVINKDITVAVEHEFKEIKVSKTEDFEIGKAAKMMSPEDFRSLLNEHTKYQFISKTGHIMKYEIYPEDEYEKVIIEIDLATSFFKKIEFVNQGNNAGSPDYYVEYKQFKPDPNFTAADFSADNILTKQEDGTYRLTNAYKTYNLIID